MPADEPALGELPDLRRWLGRTGSVVTSPAARCRVAGADVEPALGPWDLGTWSGLPLSELPDLATWRSDPGWSGHGGESLLALRSRVSQLLTRWHGRTGRWAAVTHAAVIRAAVTWTLHAPAEAAWDIDVPPASLTELHTTPTGWRVVRVSCPAQ